jgi:serine/threonine-protein kinase
MHGRVNVRAAFSAFALAVALALAPSAGHGDERADKAAAEAQFDAGLALLKAGKYADACPKLESSQSLDPAVGTLMYLGECYARLGRTASAWAAFREAGSMARALKQTDRANTAAERAAALEAQLCYLRVTVPPTYSQLEITVQRNGVIVPADLYGVEVPVDPGTIVVKATAKGREEFSESVTLAAKERKTVTLSGLAPKPGAELEPTPAASTDGAAFPPPAAPPGTPASSTAVSTDSLASDSGTGRVLPIALGAAGVVGLGIGAFYGFKAIGKNSDAEKTCSGGTCTDQAGLDFTEQAKDAALVSNIAFGAGAVLLAAGVVLYVTAPSNEGGAVALAPVLSPGGGGVSVMGAFE